MSKVVTNDFTLDVPSNWIDRSLITWVAPPTPNRQVNPNILCGRDELKPNQTLDQYVNFQLKQLMNEVDNFSLIKREAIKLNKTDAISVVFNINPRGILLRQNQIYFVTNHQKGRVSSIVATAADADFDKLEPAFDNIFKSFKLT